LDLVEAQRGVAQKDLGFNEELTASNRRAADRMAISRSLQQVGQLTMAPVRRHARKPKRPDSAQRERWFEQRSRANSARPTTSTAIEVAMHGASAPAKKMLARGEQDVTMPACNIVGAASVATARTLPSNQRVRANSTW
jgi:hypothetical protein